jgi:hypothetical protein
LDTIKAGTDGRFTHVEFTDLGESAVPMHVNERSSNSRRFTVRG